MKVFVLVEIKNHCQDFIAVYDSKEKAEKQKAYLEKFGLEYQIKEQPIL